MPAARHLAAVAGQAELALSGLSPYLPLTFTRAYSNQAISEVAAGSSLNPGALGPKWSHNWQYRLQVLNPGQTVVLWTPGGAYTFEWNAAWSTYFAEEGVNAGLDQIDSTHWSLIDALRLTRTSGGTTTSYMWDVGRGLPRMLDDGSYQYIYGAGAGPVERVALSGGTTHYFLADGLGSTLAIVDSSGTTAQTYTYDAFGKATPGMSFANEFTFAGQQTDPSGLLYLRARYMDPSTGRL